MPTMDVVDAREWLGLGAAARRANYSAQRITQLAREGKITTIPSPFDRQRLYSVQDVDRIAAAREQRMAKA